MLDKKLGRHLTVNKGRARAFLGLCVELANAKPDHYEGVFTAALKRGDFKTDFEDNEVFNVFGKQIPALVDNVTTLAVCVSTQEEFSVIARRASGIDVMDGSIVMGRGEAGTIEFYKEKRISSAPTGKKKATKEIIKEIGRNALVDTFYENLPSVLYQPKEGGPKMIPIRQCLECKKPFLARRWDQDFCGIQHSQKWRSREKYRKTQE